MFDYLIEDNLDVLQEHFQRFNIDTDPQSSDMIFIKELIYGGSLPGSEVPFYYKNTFIMAVNCTGYSTLQSYQVYMHLHKKISKRNLAHVQTVRVGMAQCMNALADKGLGFSFRVRVLGLGFRKHGSTIHQRQVWGGAEPPPPSLVQTGEISHGNHGNVRGVHCYMYIVRFICTSVPTQRKQILCNGLVYSFCMHASIVMTRYITT